MMANFSANCKTKHLTWKWLRNFLYKWIKNYDCVSKVIILNQNWWVHFDIPYALLYAVCICSICVVCVCVCVWLVGWKIWAPLLSHTHNTHTHSQSKRSTYIQFTAVMNLSHRILLPLSPFWFFFLSIKTRRKRKKKSIGQQHHTSIEHSAQSAQSGCWKQYYCIFMFETSICEHVNYVWDRKQCVRARYACAFMHSYIIQN